MTTELDLAAYLRDKGVEFYRARGSELQMPCLFGCHGSAVRGRGKLYINAETWLGICFVCDTRVNRRQLLEHFGDKDEIEYIESSDPALRHRILTEAADLANEMLLANEGQMSYLMDRGIDVDLIVKHRLGYVPQNFGLSSSLPCRTEFKGYGPLVGMGMVRADGAEFFNRSLVIPYTSHGSIVQLRARDVDKRYRTMGGDTVRLYNADALFGADEVLIVEGEFDVLRVLSVLQSAPQRSLPGNLAVVGLPGAGSWPENLIERLSEAHRVFIGLDADDTGRKAAAKLKDEIGTKARIVDIPQEGADWTDWLHDRTWRDLRDLLHEADLAGKHMFSVVDLAAKWSQRQKEAPGMKLGWNAIDSVIRPGLKPGQVMIPLATTGTGKSVFLSNLAHNLRNRRTLYVSLEMTGAEIFEHLRRIHRFWNPKVLQDDMLVDYPHLKVTERNRIGKGDLGELIEEYADLHNAKPELVIVDYLQYYARGFKGSGMYDRVGDAIMEIKAVAKEENAGFIVPSQVNRGAERGKPLSLDSARDGGVIEETGDFVLSLFRPDQAEQRDGEPLASTGLVKAGLLKSRHGGTGRVFDLRFSALSLAMTDVVFDRANTSRVDQENALDRRGIHHDDWRRGKDEELVQGVLDA